MSRQARLHRLPAGAPDDVAALERAFDAKAIDPARVVAVFGKTEGNGNVNDFTRALASRALHDALAARIGRAAADRACLVMSGGTEGGLSPHWLVFEVVDSPAPAEADALAIGIAHTPDLPGEHLGRLAQVELVAAGVREAMAAACIGSADEVELVQVKCPLLTSERVGAVARRGRSVATADTLKSMALSRAASALGVALALGEVPAERLTAKAIGADRSLFSSRASASAGVELTHHEVVVLGRGQGWSGPLRIARAVMADAIDLEPVRAALDALDLPAAGQLAPAGRSRIHGVIAKVEAAASGTIRGSRHAMLTDSDIGSTRHARAFAGGALAGLFGFTELFVSGGAEHQGPDGGGPVAVIASRAPEGPRP